ncbi:DUF6161 domain-containing protein [Vibrio mediterranei]|uniref:DUF6161 domain-containing protein n=1 Tax=Vibrio mediterranei TaxID=689 RepID=UPI00148D2D04|nr:DUF6161 domain-containing protein [Vibrio mediterranei]NOH31451.1 hypothetical protein [Vibrio mediterranei]
MSNQALKDESHGMENTESKSADSLLNEVAIPLGLNEELHHFLFVNELRAFINQERENWDWLGDQSFNHDRFLRSQIKNIFQHYIQKLETLCSQWESNDREGCERTIVEIGEIQEAWKIPTSSSPIGKYILELANSHKVIASQFWLIWITPSIENAATHINHPIKKIFDTIYNANGGQGTVALRATEPFRLIATTHMIKVSLLMEHKGAQKWLDSINDLHSEMFKTREQASLEANELVDWTAKLKSSVLNQIDEGESKSRLAFIRFAKEMINESEKLKQENDKIRDDALEKLKTAEESYRTKIDLDESVGYWDNKKTEHNTDKEKWYDLLKKAILATLTVPLITLGLQTLFIKLSWIEKADLWAGSVHPSIAAIGIITLSLGSYAIRFCSQQYQSQQHLYLEAVERRTMIKTYLALHSEGKLNTQEDRKIALDTLFRPAQTGIINDVSAVLPTEQIVKVVSSRNPT